MVSRARSVSLLRQHWQLLMSVASELLLVVQSVTQASTPDLMLACVVLVRLPSRPTWEVTLPLTLVTACLGKSLFGVRAFVVFVLTTTRVCTVVLVSLVNWPLQDLVSVVAILLGSGLDVVLLLPLVAVLVVLAALALVRLCS